MNAPAPPPPQNRLLVALRGLAALGLIAAWLVVVRRQGWVEATGGAMFALGFLLVAGTIGGKVAAFFRLPQLTGYLAVGVISGPYVLALFEKDDVEDLKLINTLALALIALQAGAELTLPMLRRSLRSLMWASVGHAVIITLGMTALFALLSPYMPFLDGLALPAVLAVGLLWGAMAVSKAPADTLAILGETGAKGPLAEHALGVVVLLDVVVLILFAVALMFAKAALNPEAALSLHVFADLGQELVVSVAAGTTFGLVIAAYFWAVGKEKLLFTVGAAYGITAFCAYFHYDTLLVFVVAGFVVMNLTKFGHDLVETTESAGAAVMVVFFATAGAQLNIGALKTYGFIALGLAFGRIGLTFLASRLGHRLAKDPPSVRKFAFTSFISQAGVTIGLGTIAANQLGEVGGEIAVLVIAVIGINEMIGPVAFKIGLAKGLKLENELDQIHELPDEQDPAMTPPPPDVAALVDEALADFTYETKQHDDRVEVYVLMDDDDKVDGNFLIRHAGEAGWSMHLRSQLFKPAAHRVVLIPERGMLKVVQRIGELEVGDQELDDAFIIDAKSEASPFIRSLKTPLLALSPFTLRVEIESRRFLVAADDLPDDEALRTALIASAELWKQLVRKPPAKGPEGKKDQTPPPPVEPAPGHDG